MVVWYAQCRWAVLCVIWCTMVNANRSPEENRLLRFFELSDGNRWKKKTGWNTTMPVCNWFGVKCDPNEGDENRGVTSVVLENNNLVGRIAKLIYEMPHLKILKLKDNKLTKAGFEGLERDDASPVLRVVDLGKNAIRSVEGIENAPASLRELHLTENKLDGTFPLQLTQLSGLKKLLLSFNKIKGTLPTEIGLLKNLEKLYLYGNQLKGSIPSEIGLLDKLEVLTLSENALTGPIPSTVNNMVNLRTFSIHNNEDRKGRITGKIPSFNKSPFIEELYLNGNELTGSLPSQFLMHANDTNKLISVSFSDNNLVGTIPSSFKRFRRLNIDLSGNRISGLNSQVDFCSKRAWMTGLVESFGCDAILCPPGTFNRFGRRVSKDDKCAPCNNSNFFGAKKCGEKKLQAWQVLLLLYRELGGRKWAKANGWSKIDEILEKKNPKDIRARDLDICNNWFGVRCRNGTLTSIRLSQNGLVGKVPLEVFTLKGLENLDLSRNAVELDAASINAIGQSSSLKILSISGTKVESLDGIGKATSLLELYLDGLDLGGTPLPTGLFNLTRLEVLHVQFSYFTGTIPTHVGQMTELRSFNLYNNELIGSLPTELGRLQKLRTLELSENAFTGTLPTELNRLSRLERLRLHQVAGTLKGALPSFNSFPKLHELSLDSNQFSGSIPPDFLDGLEDKTRQLKVSLTFNKLVGSIPAELAQFPNLDIQLEGNKITAIPSVLCNMTEWMNGEVGKVGSCDAILCPPDTWSLYGKASSKLNVTCEPCEGNTEFGTTVCKHDIDPYPEKTILDKLYTLTGGRYWTKNGNWTTPGIPICHREGVICDGSPDENTGVLELVMTGFGLNGLVPTEIFKLPSLKLLSLNENEIDVSFANIGEATNLRTLKLTKTNVQSLEGIGGANSRLTEIHLTSCDLSGNIPTELYLLANVKQLFLNNNHFTGPLSDDIINMRSLEQLFFSRNDITGQLPTQIGELTKLNVLDLSLNKLSGNLPLELGKLENLRRLRMRGQRSKTKLSGPLPSFATNKALLTIDLSSNDLTGTIPESFVRGVPNNTAISINLQKNMISGPLPASLDRFSRLSLDLSDNEISNVPDILCDGDNDDWMEGLVRRFGCRAILCPPGTAQDSGHQAEAGKPCKTCLGGPSDAPFWGATQCASGGVGLVERNRMIDLYRRLNGTNWLEQTDWLSDKSVCAWAGVTCDDRGVTELNLKHNRLGNVNPNDDVSQILFSFPFMEKLDISGNKLILNLRHIPGFSRLKILKISATGLQSLEGISNATDLRRLHATDNMIRGPIPNELYQLKNIRSLFLSFNSLTGTLSNRISELSNLEDFYLFGNQISGTLPDGGQISSLTNLKEFVMAENYLTGTIPPSFSNLPKLEQLSLYQQQGASVLQGKIPNFAGAPNLWYLDLNGNSISGTIPQTFLMNSKFKNESIAIFLNNNDITGTLPTELAEFESIDFHIFGNKITGIPPEVCAKEKWMQGMSGTISSCAAILCPPGTFHEEGRQVSLDAPCKSCPFLSGTDVWGNQQCSLVKQEKAILQNLFRSTRGASWSFNSNWNSDMPICSWEGIVCDNGNQDDDFGVTGIELQDNNLVGTLPSSIWDLPALESLNFKENSDLHISFEGVGDASNLRLMYFSETRIDSIDGVSKATSLNQLHLTGCGIGGTFPEEVFDLSESLEGLFIAFNAFSGTLSTKIGKMQKLRDLYAFDNDFSGTLPSQLGQASSLRNIVLSENLITGSIPTQMSTMPNLQLLSLFRRAKPGRGISGPLPAFNKNPLLTDLYLDQNQITGTIPPNFLSASKDASLIILSNNRISGRVPESLKVIPALRLHLEGNEITSFPPSFCDKGDWMGGAVGKVGCNAILCQPDTFSVIGRANETVSCEPCPENESAKYFGSTRCGTSLLEQNILIDLYNNCGGKDWYTKTGWMSDASICEWFGVVCNQFEQVISIDLGSNNLVGTPPTDLFELEHLRTLYLHSNPIDFKFDNIFAARQLTDLRLDATGLDNVNGIQGAPSLTHVNLGFNQLNGAFPTQLLAVKTLRSLDLGHNLLSKALPESFGELRYLATLRLSFNEFTGPLPLFDDVNVLQTLDLSNNRLSGTIPTVFLSSVSSTLSPSVNLASNSLEGVVPSEWRRFDNFNLYLRDNHITNLPKSLCSKNLWNDGDVENYGCNGILCPPGTFSLYGREQDGNECTRCADDNQVYGRASCLFPASSSVSLRPLFQIGMFILIGLGGWVW